MKTLKLGTGTMIESSYCSQHSVEITNSSGNASVTHYDANDNEIEIELIVDITYVGGVVTDWEIYSDTEGIEVQVDLELAKELAQSLQMDNGAELNW